MKISKIVMSAAAAAVFALVPVSRAGDAPAASSLLAVLSTATQAELPAKAADLVSQAGAKQQQQTTIDVVKAAVGLNPAAAPAIVGSIAQTTPAMAAIAAATAAGLVPDQVTAIARAAAAAAPSQAGKIVESLCRVLPAAYRDVAETVAGIVPGAGKEILGGVSTAIPALKAPINNILIANKGEVSSVSAVLDAAKPSAMPMPNGLAGGPKEAFAPLAVSPVVLPPYQTPPNSPNNIDPGSGGQVPPGGRVYSQP
jgi:hypothetical protein